MDCFTMIPLMIDSWITINSLVVQSGSGVQTVYDIMEHSIELV